MSSVVASIDARPLSVETGRGPLEYAEWGDGPAVLALHGAMGGFDQGLLLAQSAVGEPRFRFVAVSRPGYLGTPLAVGRTPEEQADAYVRLLDSLGVDRAAVIAISGGGQSALQFALRHPERCRALVMISACSAQLTVRIPLRFYLMKLLARVPGMETRLRRKVLADREAAAKRSIPDDAMRERTLRDPDAGRLLAALQLSTTREMRRRLPGTDNDIRKSRSPFQYPVEQVSAPVLVVHGTADEVVPVEQSRRLAEHVSRAELLLLDGAPHSALFTHLHQIRAKVGSFLNQSLA